MAHQAPVVVLVDMAARPRITLASSSGPAQMLVMVVTPLLLLDYQQTIMPLGRLTGPLVLAAVAAAGQ